MSRVTLRALALGGVALLAGCSSGGVPLPAYPVYLLASLRSDEQAWAAAAKQDQPVLILGSGVYGLSGECVPQRYYAAKDADRLLGSKAEGRMIGSTGEGRLGGSASEGRLSGSASDGRLGGAAGDGRLTGSTGDGRLTGSAGDGRLKGGGEGGRLMGSGLSVRSFGDDAIGRLYGAESSPLTCRLADDRATIYIMHVPKGMTGYLYSPRVKGRMEGVALYN